MISVSTKVNIDVNKQEVRAKKAIETIRPKVKLQIAKDCNKNVPMKNNHLRNSAIRSASINNDFIRWDTPYAHFQHEGKVMIGEKSHSPWARHGEKKIYNGKNLTYRMGGSKWVEKTMAERLDTWIRGAKKLFNSAFGG